MPEGRLRVGFVGGGWVTCNRHMPAARAQPLMELVGLVTSEADLARINRETLTSRFRLRHFTSNLSDPWFRDHVDAAIIGTPPETHYELVMECLHMGKHVLVEKPFALGVAQAEEMIAAARSADVKLGLVHNFQFLRSCLRARQMYQSGQLGELRGVIGFQSSNQRRRLPSWYKPLPLGLFTDESPHLIYLLQSVLPDAKPKAIFVGPPMSDEDNTPQLVSAQLQSPAGGFGSLQMVFVGALSEWHFVLFGSKRTIAVDLFRDILHDLPDDKEHKSLDVLRTSFSAIGSHVAGFVPSGFRHARGRMEYGTDEVFRRFTESVLYSAPLDGISAEDGKAVVEVIERINQAAPHFERV